MEFQCSLSLLVNYYEHCTFKVLLPLIYILTRESYITTLIIPQENNIAFASIRLSQCCLATVNFKFNAFYVGILLANSKHCFTEYILKNHLL